MSDNRQLSDADVAAIVDALEARVNERFVRNVGSGVLSFAWKAVVIGLLALAAYGTSKGIRQ
jgi:hypothetical protein